MNRRSSRLEERRALGSRLRDAAQAAGYTSDSMAEALGVQGGSVRGWWVGRNEPSLERLKQYAALVRRSPGFLLYGEERPIEPPETLKAWREQFAELVRAGVEPLEALDQVSGTAAEGSMSAEDRQAISGAGDAMRAVLQEASGGHWDRLNADQREAVLRLIETMAQANPLASGADAQER
jgi:transcriptional regulator with XRE-family HTH domain